MLSAQLLRTIHHNKPIITLFEGEASKGRLTFAELGILLQNVTDLHEKWHLTDEMKAWGLPAPSAKELHDALFQHDPIEWNRIGWCVCLAPAKRLGFCIRSCIVESMAIPVMDVPMPPILVELCSFQDVTMRLIAERILMTKERPTMLQDEMAKQHLPPLRTPLEPEGFHVYCSRHNLGAAEVRFALPCMHEHTLQFTPNCACSQLMAEIGEHHARRHGKSKASRTKLPTSSLHVTEEIDSLEYCDFMVVYLTAQTWTSGDTSASFAKEVQKALEMGTELLLCHEMASDFGGQRERHGIDFDSFFACEQGTVSCRPSNVCIPDCVHAPRHPNP